MRNLFCAFLLLFSLIACKEQSAGDNAEPETAEVDEAAIKQKAGELTDRYYDFHRRAGESGYLDDIVTDNALLMGTDPTEIYDKKSMAETYAQYHQDPTLAEMLNNLELEVTDRRVMVSEDGKQAIVVDEVDVSFSELPVRGVTVVEKMGEDWKITFSSVALLVNNNDLARIDSLLTQ